MNVFLEEIITVAFTLFAVIDIIGSLPIIISLKNKNTEIQPLKATLFSGLLMLGFLFIGENFLNFIGLDLQAFAIAGSIVIFIIAIEMILGITLFKEDPDANVGSIFPIAFPLLAGSGTLTSIMSMKSIYPLSSIIIGILANLVFIWVVLNFTDVIEKKLGKNGLLVIRKFFGVLLLAIAVKIFKTNF